MGHTSSRETKLTQEETKEAQTLKARVENEEPEAIAQHVKENLDRWKNEKLKIGISGRIKTGKSTFINAVLGFKPNQLGAAKTGSGNTTQQVTPYTHPQNEQIVLFDFPGVGTEDHSKSNYMKKINASECDYFFIFFDSVISTDDIWLAERLTEIKTPFCFVRSMIDQDINNAKFDGKDSDTVLGEFRGKVQTSVASSSITSKASIFFISGRYPDKGEFWKLLTHMEKNISSLKFESILFSISAISKEVIEMKYQKLKSRVNSVSFGAAAISADPTPIIDLAINLCLMIDEIHHYINTFGLSMDKIECIPTKVKENLNVWSILTKSGKTLVIFITGQIGKAAAIAVGQSFADALIPFIGSLISAATTYFVVKDFMNKCLDQMKEDAIVVYDSVLFAQEHLQTEAQVC